MGFDTEDAEFSEKRIRAGDIATIAFGALGKNRDNGRVHPAFIEEVATNPGKI